MPTTDEPQKAKDFTSDQEVRWCPGCGDYVILNTIRNFLPELGLRRENIAFVSGIGCSSRFPYYLETYGFHSIHGRAPTIATGLALARPDLSVWVVTGDGDALSIGGNHLIHALRRNVNMTILLFNNRIYGLTKGQYSPTSEVGKVTKSTPMGSLDYPFNPVSLALGAEATFVGRALDSDRKGLSEVLRAAAEHRGAAIVEILQDCPIFNDGSFDVLRKEGAEERVINVHQGEPIIFGADGEYCVVKSGFGLDVAKTADVAASEIVVHDAQIDDPAYAFALSRLQRSEPRAHRHGDLPAGQPAHVRRRGPRAGDRRPRRHPARPARAAVAAAGPRHLDRGLAPAVSASAPLAAVVLAGGASRRMGRDKATMPHPDAATTMVEHTVEVLRTRCDARVRRSPRRVSRCPALQADVLRDDIRGVGPLLATGRGLRAAAQAGRDRAFVSAVDMPYLSTEVIDELVAYETSTSCCRGTDATTTWPGSTAPTSPTHIDALVAAGERSMRALAETVVTQRVVLPPTRALTNANSLADLAQQTTN